MENKNGGHLVWCRCGRVVYTQTEGLVVKHLATDYHEYIAPGGTRFTVPA